MGLAYRPRGDLWIFGYGSLMWQPGFDYVRAAPALLRGYHRAFCVYSVRYRGTPEEPGLVLGLDRGGACRGIAFLVASADVEAVLEQLWEREMPRLVYRPRVVPVEVESKRVPALAFLAHRRHESYAGRLPISEIARTIARRAGAAGSNADYLRKALRHLHHLGIRERALDEILRAVDALCPRTGLENREAADALKSR